MTERGSTLAEVGEFGALARLLPTIPDSDAVVLGPGDDAAVFRLSGDAVCSTDLLVEGVHFRRDWSSATDVGRKAVAVNVSDIEAMGAVPVAMVIGLSAPGDLPVQWLADFLAGVVAECAAAGVALVGGDTTRSRDVTVAVTVIGQTEGRAAVTRAGARVGDVVAVKGRLGWAAAGLAVLARGFRSPRAMVDAQRVAATPYGAGREAAAAGATAMIDVSDGLLADLGHICELSGVAIDVDPAALEVPEAMQAVAAATGKDPLGFVLTGGEDQALAATFPTERVPAGWTIVGRVVEQTDGPAVTVAGEAWQGPGGWDHFG